MARLGVKPDPGFFRPVNPDKLCHLCGLPKKQCRKLAGTSSGFGADPRGFSSPMGLRTLSDHTLSAICAANAGEWGKARDNAAKEIERRRQISQIEQDETVLSPYEQQLYRSKGLPMECKSDGLVHAVRIEAPSNNLSREERRRLFLASKSDNKAERAAAMHALSPPDPE